MSKVVRFPETEDEIVRCLRDVYDSVTVREHFYHPLAKLIKGEVVDSVRFPGIYRDTMFEFFNTTDFTDPLRREQLKEKTSQFVMVLMDDDDLIEEVTQACEEALNGF